LSSLRQMQPTRQDNEHRGPKVMQTVAPAEVLAYLI